MAKRPFIKALLIDISGNLVIGAKPTPMAVEAIKRLRESKIPFRLCSNASKESTAALVAKLNVMGFDFAVAATAENVEVPNNGDGSPAVRPGSKKEVWTSIGSVAQYVEDRGFKRPYMLLSESARNEVFPEEGNIGSTTGYDAVVVGLAPGLFDYEHLNTAFRILTGEADRTGSGSDPTRRLPLIATHKAKYIEKDDPPGLSLGPGPFVTALENATGCEAHVVGKPTKTFFELVINNFSSSELHQELDEEETEGKIAVVGDDVEADLGGGALDLGLWRVLVKTGKYRSGDEIRPGVVPPDEVHENFATFIDDLLSNQMVGYENESESKADRCDLM